MKRVSAVFVLATLVAGALVFADDATLLPQGVFRIRAIPSYTMLDKAYDDSGKAQDSIKGSLTAMSGAAELGILPAITFGVQWAPGYYVASDLSNLPSGFEKMVMTGPDDIKIGAKLLLLGADGFVQNDKLRIALTPGVQIPLDAYDAAAEAKDLEAGKDFRGQSSSTHQSLGFGAKADVDYLLSDMFFINAHGEAKYYLPNESLAFETVVAHDMTYAAYYAAYLAASDPNAAADAAASADAAAPLTKTKSEYGINSFFELEPHFKYVVSKSLTINAGLPVSYTMNLGTKTTYDGTSTTSDPGSLLTVGPNVSAFMLLGPLPAEVELQYVLPLMGKNSTATNTLSLQFKIFGKAF